MGAVAAREQAREQREQSGVRPEQREEMARQLSELLSRMSSEVEHVKRQVELCKTEDHSQPPSQEDVDRYFEYPTNYVNNIKGIFYPPGGDQVTEMLVLGLYLPDIDHSNEVFYGCPNITPTEYADKLADN